MANVKQETQWVLRAQTGDIGALNELFKTIQNPLYRYILSLIGEPAIAEDVLQEVFILIYRKLYWLREPELFLPWAYRIAGREALKALKKERRWSEQIRDESALEALPADMELQRFEPEMIEHIPKLLERVSPTSRAVLVLHYLHEMPLGEVSVVLGAPVGTIKSRLAYGLATLRKVMRESGLSVAYKDDDMPE